MATKTRIVKIDDLDGTPGAETVKFSVGSAAYEIDLHPAHRQWLLDCLLPFTNAARKIGKQRREGPPTSLVRAWAQAQGLHVSERGRICASVVKKYEAAHLKSLSASLSVRPEKKP